MKPNASIGALLATLLLLLAPTVPGQPQWRVVKPSNTGIPGELIHQVRFAPDQTLWVAARWPDWQQGGLGLLDRTTQVWTNYSNWETPLRTEFINDLAFEPGGVAWLATDAGLIRFDGAQWTVWDTSNAPLLHNTVASVDVAPNGHVWFNNSNVLNQTAAIFEFDGAVFRRYTVGQQIPFAPPWNSLSDVIVSRDGHVWVSNQTLPGIAEYDGQTWRLHGAPIGQVGGLLEDRIGNIWMAAGVSGGNYFWVFDRTAVRTIPASTTPTVLALDDDGTVYLGDWGNVRRSTDGGQTVNPYLTGLNPVVDIAPDPASTDVWVGTRGAVGRFAADGTLLRDYNSYNTGIPWYWIDRFDLDRAGHLWFATGEAGLSRFDGRLWRNWGAHNARSEPYPFGFNEPMGSFHLDRAGVGWMGGNGIARWNPATGQFNGFWNWQNNPGMESAIVTRILEDGAGNLFATMGRVFRFDGTLWVLQPGVLAPYGLAVDGRGNVWAADQYRLHRWDGQSWTTVGEDWGLFGLGGVTCIAAGPDDTLWVGTNGGLIRVVGTVRTLFTPAGSPLPALQVQGIDVRADGVVAVSAHEFGPVPPFPNGVAVIRGNADVAANWTVHRYGQTPIPHYQLGAVKFDAAGSLWISALSEGCAVLLAEPPFPPAAPGHENGGLPILAAAARIGTTWSAYFSLPPGAGSGPDVLALSPGAPVTPAFVLDPPATCARGFLHLVPVLVLVADGNPAAFRIPIPGLPALVGQRFTVQGAMVEASGCARLTDAIVVTLQM
jgi:ligand-binding sensor domain-containing protein